MEDNLNSDLLEREDIDYTQYLPTANINRIIKSAFENEFDCKLSKEASITYLEILNEFISFITNETIEETKNDGRKTLTGLDVIMSLEKLGFDHYSDSLRKLLEKISLNHVYNYEMANKKK